MEANNQLFEFVAKFLTEWKLTDLSITGFISMCLAGVVVELIIIYSCAILPLTFMHRNDKYNRVVDDLPFWLFSLKGLYVTPSMIKIHYDLSDYLFRKKIAPKIKETLDCHNRYAVYGVPGDPDSAIHDVSED